MSEQIPDPDQSTTPAPPPPPPQGDWREQRHAEREARREERRQGGGRRPYGWFTGLILLLLGIYFLLQNLGVPIFANWWAIFFLFPAFWAFVGAWSSYQNHQRLTRGAVSSLVIGVLFTILAVIFLLNLATNFFWPILLIIAGMALLISALYPH